MKHTKFLFTILIISLIGLPQIALGAVNRISGNGYIFPETTTYKATFSMDVSRDGANPPAGWVKYYYSRTRMNMVSTGITDLTTSGIGTTASLSGTCTINNIAGYTFSITAIDKVPDSFQIKIFKPDGSVHYSAGPKNLSGGNLTVTDTIPPAVSITSPENLITVGSSPINISGTVDDSSATVTVNGIPATIVNGQFTVTNVTISEGMNTIVARAIDPSNNISTTSINISLDSTPPQIAITSPPDGYVAASSSITVTGIINDIVRGTVNESQGRVLVNGIEAGISNRNFIVESMPLSPGENTITAVGSDQWGNTASTSITVNYDTTPRAMINMVSGNNQSGNIGSTLPEPFVVSVVDETGTPVVGATTIFRVTENNGMLTGSESGRAVAVVTDADGLARATLTLGTWAGSGNNKVEVTSTGVDGSVIFTASGLQKPPAAIYVAQGSQQRGAVNQLLPEPLVAFVTDEGHNPLGNVPVIFNAVEGGGLFANGLDTITVNTDSDGRATVAFTLGPIAGNDSNVMQATFEGNSGPPASFTATGLVPGDPGNTRISGVVLDNSNNPIPNVTMRVEGTTREALTDATGQFVIENVPVGPVHMIADGTTAGIRGVIEYPKLMYEMTTIAGANNTVGMPIYLLPLDLANAKWVGGDEDVTYTIPDVPGFELTIKANSVTFPDGSKGGYISVTQVHADKVPMVPQIGQQPRFIITIQPPGAIFDPPAPITLPNVDGLAPGEKTNMYSFDHDLGIFVSIGTGTVSEDGMVIQSDPGVGVVKAGWHCGGNPAPIGSTNNCPECAPCNANTQLCTPLPSGTGCTDDGNVCTEDKCGVCTAGNCPGGGCTHPAKADGTAVQGEECKECKGGNVANKLVELTSATAKANGKDEDVVLKGKVVNFTGTATGNNCEFEYNWDFGDGGTSTSQNPSHTYTNPGEYTVTLKVKCKKCSPPEKTDTVKVTVSLPEIKLEKVGNAVIEPGNKYSENTTLKATAIFPTGHSQAGQTVTDFNETITFAEESGTNYYNGNNGATLLPKDVAVTSGVATIIIKSLSNSDDVAGPVDAKIKATAADATQHVATNWLAVNQWVDENSDGFIDWLEQHSRAILTCAQGKAGELGSVTSEVTSIQQWGGVDCGVQYGKQTSINISPVCATPNRHRLNINNELSDTILHESRHVWQKAYEGERNDVGTDDDGKPATPSNDDDDDYLPETVSFASANNIRDSVAGTGDNSSDNWTTVVSPALEVDAPNFAGTYRNQCP